MSSNNFQQLSKCNHLSTHLQAVTLW